MSNIDKPALFLDRDGVINRKLEGDYVRNWSEFEWLPGVEQALLELKKYFYPILVITNQQGIGKKIMSETDLQRLHLQVEKYLIQTHGNAAIHDFYYCPHLASAACSCRKPANGMFLQAGVDYPFIRYEKSWMVGDSWSDIEAARSLGIRTAFVGKDVVDADLNVLSLQDFSKQVKNYIPSAAKPS